ncbi:erythromycin esterase [Virgisporangium aliadipatigenens]|uniref:Erythromycin esterase n=1 Tax=Virgisporangium aliadipatigenens TaxID=741659 RepID=A0A8J3YFX3_9ACTN|nr:erythromycin esterase family protein [Virgisporangium aliadipatigenens]GIJ43251.1 erythromycin esterase [Virgisporangium aliadipatigenens]
MTFAGYVRDNAFPLGELDPGVFRDARVVAVGENAHLVREFYTVRQRLLRFLVRECGFTVLAWESGFSEGLAVDAWLRGEPGDVKELADNGITYTMGRCAQMRDLLTEARALGTRFVGLDVPGSTASTLPALRNVRRYLEKADPAAVSIVDGLVERANAWAGEHMLPAYSAYSAQDPAARDAATAAYADLCARFDGCEWEYRDAAGDDAYATARHELRLAALLDQTLRGHAARLGGQAALSAFSSRDRAMAETVRWVLDRDPDARVVVMAHNTHIQRVPVAAPGFTVSGLGHHLARAFGAQYLSVAVTNTGGRTVGRALDPDSPAGFAIVGVDLDPPAEDSVEAAFAGFAETRMLDLRPARGRLTAVPERMRLQENYLSTPLLDGHDLIVTLPEITPAEQLTAT